MADFLFSPVPHDEAAAYIAGKPVVTRQVFDKLLPELRARAFTISGVTAADAVQSIRDRIAELPAGARWDDVKRDVAGALGPHFVDPDADPEEQDAQVNASNRRAELLLRTQGFQAYQTASYETMDRQRDVFPSWQYLTMGDGKVRPSHQALNNVVLPQDSPFWQTHFPPWDFGCRCQVVPLSKEDVSDIAKADAHKLPEQRNILEGPLLDQLEQDNRLVRGPNQITNVAAPAGKTAWSWKPGDRVVTAEGLRARYDHETFGEFERWARQTMIAPGKTVWEWIAKDAQQF